MNKDSTTGERYHSHIRFNGSMSNLLTYVNPWVPRWWSAAFPGYGYLILGNTITAFSLVCFEFIVNNMAHLNEAIYLSMIGNIHGAKEILNIRWFFGYIGVYIFGMADCYRRAVENNKLYVLSYRYTKKISFSTLTPFNMNMLETTSPLLGLFWSFITPGIGAVFVYRLPTFIFSLAWWGVTVVKSHWLEAIYYSAIGDFGEAKRVLDPQWLLFIPSIVGFSMYFSYRETVNGNKRFKLQTQYLQESFQSKEFIKPV